MKFLCKTKQRCEDPLHRTPDLEHLREREAAVLHFPSIELRWWGQYQTHLPRARAGGWAVPFTVAPVTWRHLRCLWAWLTEVHQCVECARVWRSETWWKYALFKTNPRTRLIPLGPKVSRVPRCCLWDNRLAPHQVFLIHYIPQLFLFRKAERHFASGKREQLLLVLQKLSSPGKKWTDNLFCDRETGTTMDQMWTNSPCFPEIWTKDRKEVSWRDKSSTSGLFSLYFVCCAEVREAVYAYPWDDKWRLSEGVHLVIPLVFTALKYALNILEAGLAFLAQGKQSLQLVENTQTAAAWLLAAFPWQHQGAK